MKRVDITGQRFGKLVAIAFHRIDNVVSKTGTRQSRTFWECKCDCGKTTIVILGNLRKEGGTRSCGCQSASANRHPTRKDLSGQKIRELTVLRLDGSAKRAKWICECSCGKIVKFWTNQLTRPNGPKNCGHDSYQMQFRKKMDELMTNRGMECRTCNQFKPIVCFRQDKSKKLPTFKLDCIDCLSHRGYTAKILRDFSLSSDDYKKKYIEQCGKCEVCGEAWKTGDKRLCVDHDHISGKIRGLLCNGCNTGLGGFKDSPNSLARAISYLAKYHQVEEVTVKAIG